MLGIEIRAQTGDFGGLLELHLSIAETSENLLCNLMPTSIRCIFLLSAQILSIRCAVGLFKLRTGTKVESKIWCKQQKKPNQQQTKKKKYPTNFYRLYHRDSASEWTLLTQKLV